MNGDKRMLYSYTTETPNWNVKNHISKEKDKNKQNQYNSQCESMSSLSSPLSSDVKKVNEESSDDEIYSLPDSDFSDYAYLDKEHCPVNDQQYSQLSVPTNTKMQYHKCNKCYFVSSEKEGLEYHITMNHRESQTKMKLVDCTISSCNYRCYQGTEMTEHYRKSHTKSKRFECQDCNKSFYQKGNLSRHIREKHLKIKRGSSESKQEKQDNNILNISRNLTPSSIISNASNPINYGYGFLSEISKTLTNQNPHCPQPLHFLEQTNGAQNCNQNGYSDNTSKSENAQIAFPQESEWIGHGSWHGSKEQTISSKSLKAGSRKIRVHASKKKLPCKECSYKTTKKGLLQKHMRTTHLSGKSMHQCNDCLYKTWNLGHLNTHIKTMHLGIKDFACIHCDAKFSQKGHLNKHTATRHKDMEIPLSDNADMEYFTNVPRAQMHPRKYDDYVVY